MLYDYLMKSSFGECQMGSSESLDIIPRDDNANYECVNNLPASSLRKDCKRKRKNGARAKYPDSSNINNTMEIVPIPVCEGNPLQKVSERDNLQLITVQQYASRNAMLMSLTVAWSPVLRTFGNDVTIPHNPSSCSSILAVGGKDGRISFWRVRAPEYYSINKTTCSSKASLIGLQRVHDTWVTAINWALCAPNVSKAQFLLATGSSDGRVKIWKMNGDELLNISKVVIDPFSLLNEVRTVDTAAISVLSLSMSSQSPWELFVAVGKGSGSFEVWMLDIATGKLENIGCYNAHERVVTGLTWAFDGRCLYSCSQDNSMKSWILVGKCLSEVSIPTSTPCERSIPDVPCAFNSCFGLALSPGNLMIAMARRFDADLLHPMYEGRCHKSAVEFYWIGGQKLDHSPTTLQDTGHDLYPEFPTTESAWWESNILWSLKQYENHDRLLNIWDIVAVLVALKQSAPKSAEHILLKWLKSICRDQLGISIATLSEAFRFLSKVSTRQLHLINIICRHVMLKECKADNVNNKQVDKLSGSKKNEVDLWMELLKNSENELLERLVGFNLSVVLGLLFNSSTYSFEDGSWIPDGLGQMERWVSHNGKNLKDHTKFLAVEVGKVEKRKLHDIVGYHEDDEQCNFCAALVPFESTESAICSGVSTGNECHQTHKLERCAVTMRVLPTKPSWHCVCCKRWATKLAPTVLFTMPEYPSDLRSYINNSAHKNLSTPCCPLCGTLLQRLQPGHTLSPSQV